MYACTQTCALNEIIAAVAAPAALLQLQGATATGRLCASAPWTLHGRPCDVGRTLVTDNMRERVVLLAPDAALRPCRCRPGRDSIAAYLHVHPLPGLPMHQPCHKHLPETPPLPSLQ